MEPLLSSIPWTPFEWPVAPVMSFIAEGFSSDAHSLFSCHVSLVSPENSYLHLGFQDLSSFSLG